MAKISNTNAYPQINNINASDYLILTDSDNLLKTKTCTIGLLQTLFGLDSLNAKITVSNAALLALGSTNKTLIAAPGANKVLDILNISMYLDAGGVAYDFGSNGLNIDINNIKFAQIQQARINSSTDIVVKSIIGTGATDLAIGVNQPLILTADDGNPTQGTGDAYFNITYRVLTVGSSF
tara:strand:+ start:216 stop:755 length:540 start_codon:yes stop_codon:yes gene_type:complete